MKLKHVMELLNAELLEGAPDAPEREVLDACGSDMMSDVLAYVKNQALLLTGLMNAQTIRTAEMMDMKCVIFVRGKHPDASILELARERDIVVMTTSCRLYQACGKLYAAGLGCED